MGRPHRYLAPGAYYHVGTKGNNDDPIFQDDDDRRVFLQILRRVKRHYRWRLHARCLLGNHYTSSSRPRLRTSPTACAT
jgi:REP element-mobilizing transposase RayT